MGQWKEGHAVIQTRVFDGICMSPSPLPDQCREWQKRLTKLWRSTAFSWVKDIRWYPVNAERGAGGHKACRYTVSAPEKSLNN